MSARSGRSDARARGGGGHVPASTNGHGAVRAVDGVDLTVGDGEIVCVLGPSGSGKSTLLRAVAGLEPLAAGRITRDGVDLDGVPPHRRNLGLMFQDHALFPHRDVLGNVAFGLRARNVARATAEARRARDPRARRPRGIRAPLGAGALGRRAAARRAGPRARAGARPPDARRAPRLARPRPPRSARGRAAGPAHDASGERAVRHPRPRRGPGDRPTGWRSCTPAGWNRSAPPPRCGGGRRPSSSPASWAGT